MYGKSLAIFLLVTILTAGSIADKRCDYLRCRNEFRKEGAYCAHGDFNRFCMCLKGNEFARVMQCPYGEIFNEFLGKCGENTERNRKLCINFFRTRGMDPNGK